MADVKPDIKPESTTISLKLQDGNGETMTVKVKTTTKFTKIIDAYCNKKGVDPATVRLTFEGDRIEPTQTPEELDLKDDDIVTVATQMVGGGRA